MSSFDAICSNNYIFGETLSAQQCNKAVQVYSVTCTQDNFGHFQVRSNTNMTIEVCLQICITNGFFYAGLNKYYCFKAPKNFLLFDIQILKVIKWDIHGVLVE